MSQRKPRHALTALALKYGHPIGPQHTVIEDSNPSKSGLTPVEPLFQGATPAEIARAYELEEYQRDQYFGLTTAEIDRIEALAPTYPCKPELIPNTNAIHPFYARGNWDKLPLPRHLAKFPLGGGRLGYWEASNDLVWNAMYPALQLVSHFLDNIGSWPWWDALANGKYEMVEPNKLPLTADRTIPVAKFKLRDADQSSSPAEIQKLKTRFLSMAGRVELKITCGRADPENGLPYQKDDQMLAGLVDNTHTFKSYYTMYVAFEIIEPLVNNSMLKPGERAVDIHRLACLLLHETVHAFWKHDLRKKHPELLSEPYFENEVTAGLGFSLENVILGGISKALKSSSRPNLHSRSAGGGLLQTWDTVAHRDVSETPTQHVENRPSYYEVVHTPIPVGFYLDLLESVFWDSYFPVFGRQATRAGPKVFGVRATYDPTTNALISQLPFLYDTEDEDSLALDDTMSRTRKRAVEFENSRRRRSRRVKKAITRYMANNPPDTTNKTVRRANRKANRTYIEKVRERQKLAHAEAEFQHQNSFRAECPRYADITKYLINNRYELALDSMASPIAEHIMYNHILHNGGLDITADEWHNFLLICHRRQHYFSYLELGPAWGVINRIDARWPRTPLRARPIPGPQPSNKSITAVIEHFSDVLTSQGVMNYPYQDHDWNDFRDRVSHYYSRRQERDLVRGTSGRIIHRITAGIFERIIFSIDFHDLGVTYGPAGVIRWTRPAEPVPDSIVEAYEPPLNEEPSPPSPPPPSPPTRARSPVTNVGPLPFRPTQYTHRPSTLNPFTGRPFSQALPRPPGPEPRPPPPPKQPSPAPGQIPLSRSNRPSPRQLRDITDHRSPRHDVPLAVEEGDDLEPQFGPIDFRREANNRTFTLDPQPQADPETQTESLPAVGPSRRKNADIEARSGLLDKPQQPKRDKTRFVSEQDSTTPRVHPPPPTSSISSDEDTTPIPSQGPRGQLPGFQAQPRPVPLPPNPFNRMDFNLSQHNFFAAPLRQQPDPLRHARARRTSPLPVMTNAARNASRASTIWPGEDVFDDGNFMFDAMDKTERPPLQKPKQKEKDGKCRQQ